MFPLELLYFLRQIETSSIIPVLLTVRL
uniref:Uncharacterized protein n=1 Tax=Arundo donax TaxID=35708 RepID=A0A0A8ZSU1_ARUDO